MTDYSETIKWREANDEFHLLLRGADVDGDVILHFREHILEVENAERWVSLRPLLILVWCAWLRGKGADSRQDAIVELLTQAARARGDIE